MQALFATDTTSHTPPPLPTLPYAVFEAVQEAMGP